MEGYYMDGEELVQLVADFMDGSWRVRQGGRCHVLAKPVLLLFLRILKKLVLSSNAHDVGREEYEGDSQTDDTKSD